MRCLDDFDKQEGDERCVGEYDMIRCEADKIGWHHKAYNIGIGYLFIGSRT